VSPAHTIARLEALLERVRTRAAQPRLAAAPARAPEPPRAQEPTPAQARMPAPALMPALTPAPTFTRAPEPEPAPTRAPAPPPAQAHAPAPPAPAPTRDPITVPPPAFVLDEPVDDLETTQSRAIPSRPQPARTDADIVVDVDVQASTHETVLAVPVEDAAIPEPLDSRERLVAAEPAVEPVAEPAIELPTDAVIEMTSPQPAVEVVEPEPEPAPEVVSSEETLSPEQVEEVEEIEEAPASSRRPLAPPAGERLEEMAFGAVEPEPPRHTPPPESGRLLAAPEVEFDGDITGVRDSKSAHPPVTPEALVPEATLASLGPSDDVAAVTGAPKPPAPATFLAVLEASLAL
jgi:hypothetical protein